MDIVCLGGGPAGLYCAILLKIADPSCKVVVYERNSRNHVIGWGMGFWGGSWDDLLDSLYNSDAQTAQRVDDNAIRWRGQEVIVAGEVLTVAGVGYGIRHGTLVKILTDRALEVGVEIRFEQAVTGMDQIGEADVIIAADGVGSLTRGSAQDRFGSQCLVGGNKFVWLGSHKVFDAFTNVFERTDSGWIWLHGYAVDPDTSVCIIECSSVTWHGLGLDTLGAVESLRLLESIFGAVLDGCELLCRDADAPSLPWECFRTITNRQWWSEKTVLVGDAAHTAHFSIGSGTRLALQDAITLASSLGQEQSPQAAFADYQRRRRPDVLAAQRDAGASARWLEELDRYVGMPAEEFFTLFRARRDPLLARISPELYYRAYSAVERNPLLCKVKEQVGPAARQKYGRLLSRLG